jgi:hypothetical protein
LKSDRTENSPINITQDNETFSDPEVVSNLFNIHLTSLASESDIVRSDCSNFIEKLFSDIKKERRKPANKLAD